MRSVGYEFRDIIVIIDIFFSNFFGPFLFTLSTAMRFVLLE